MKHALCDKNNYINLENIFWRTIFSIILITYLMKLILKLIKKMRYMKNNYERNIRFFVALVKVRLF